MDVGGHGGQLGLSQLKVRESLAEHLPRRGTVQTFFHGWAGKTQGGGGDGSTENIEGGQGHFEPPTSLSETLFARDAAVLEDQTRQRVWSDYFHTLRNLKARCSGFHNERADPARSFAFGGAGKNNAEVCDATVGDPGLVAA